MNRPWVALWLLLLPAAHADPGGPAILQIEIRDNFPILVAKIDGEDVPLKFDLGDSDALVLQQEVLDRAKALPTGETVKRQGLSGTFEAPLFRLPRIQIGDLDFKNVVARLDRRDPTYTPGGSGEKGYLGTGLLKEHRVVLDYPRRIMTLIPTFDVVESSGSCKGTVVPFSPKFGGEPVTEAETDFGRALLWWDTGSPISFLTRKFVTAPRPQADGETMETRQLGLGGADFGPLRFVPYDVLLPGFDGAVGYDFFARHVVCVDFPGKRLLIANGKN